MRGLRPANRPSSRRLGHDLETEIQSSLKQNRELLALRLRSSAMAACETFARACKRTLLLYCSSGPFSMPLGLSRALDNPMAVAANRAGGGYVEKGDGMSGVRLLAGLVIGTGLAGSAGPSPAQDARIRAGGIRVDPGFARGVPQRINRGEAVRIARSLGMQDVNTVRRTGRQWRLRKDERGVVDPQQNGDNRTRRSEARRDVSLAKVEPDQKLAAHEENCCHHGIYRDVSPREIDCRPCAHRPYPFGYGDRLLRKLAGVSFGRRAHNGSAGSPGMVRRYNHRRREGVSD